MKSFLFLCLLLVGVLVIPHTVVYAGGINPPIEKKFKIVEFDPAVRKSIIEVTIPNTTIGDTYILEFTLGNKTISATPITATRNFIAELSYFDNTGLVGSSDFKVTNQTTGTVVFTDIYMFVGRQYTDPERHFRQRTLTVEFSEDSVNVGESLTFEVGVVELELGAYNPVKVEITGNSIHPVTFVEPLSVYGIYRKEPVKIKSSTDKKAKVKVQWGQFGYWDEVEVTMPINNQPANTTPANTTPANTTPATTTSSTTTSSTTTSANTTPVPSNTPTAKHKLTVQALGKGTVVGGGEYDAGTRISIIASADKGWSFSEWRASVPSDLIMTDKTKTATEFQMPAMDTVIYAVFKEGGSGTDGQYTLTMEVDPSKGGTVNSGGKFNEGDTVKLEATPKKGYRFIEWRISPSSDAIFAKTKAETDLKMPKENVKVTAYFEEDNGTGGDLQFNVGVRGTGGTVDDMSGFYYRNDKIKLLATPDSGYKFKSWVDSANIELSTETSFTYTMPNKESSVYALFEKGDAATGTKKTVTIIGQNSSFTSGLAYEPNTMVTLTAVPYQGYEFVKWEIQSGVIVLSSPTSTTTSFMMPSTDVVLLAIVQPITTGGGVIVPTYPPTSTKVNPPTGGGAVVDDGKGKGSTPLPLTGDNTNRNILYIVTLLSLVSLFVLYRFKLKYKKL